jgi:hypothetical protein
MWLALAVGAAAAGGVAIGGRWRRDGWPDAVLAALLPPCAVVVLALAGEQIAAAPTNGWNELRLAPSAALRLGYDLYALPGRGPMLGHIYGPVSPLVYMAAALMPTPTAAIRTGVVLTIFLCLIPAVSLVRVAGGAASPMLKTAGVLLFALVCFESDVLSHAAFWIHADTPAVAFAALALVPLVTARRRRHLAWQVVSALAVVLAVGSKQVALPVVFALPAYIWLADGWRGALRYVGLVGVWGEAGESGA